MDDSWNVNPLKEELNSYRDRDRFTENQEEADYPVYGGSNIYQFTFDDSVFDIESPSIWSVDENDPKNSAKHRIREKRFNSGEPKNAIYEAFDGDKTSKSKVQFVDDLLVKERDEPLSLEDVQLDCSEYRIGFRDITNSSNERTMIASVLPKGVVCEDTLQTIRPFYLEVEKSDLAENPLESIYKRQFTDEELFVTVGLLNSIPFDFLIATKVDTHISKYKLEESQVPRLTEGDDWFHYISSRAARLNCYGDEFEEMRERLGGIDSATDPDERQRLQAEIDAAAFHAYGLDREETNFVLDDFHRVRDPRMMTEDYFDLVAETYDELAEKSPMD